MKFTPALIEGVLIKRYKRFLADVQLSDGSIVTVHCTNTGSMKEVLNPPQRAWILPASNPKRKLPYTLVALENHGVMIGVHTHLANDLVAEALETRKIPELPSYTDIRREVKVSDKSRLDFCITLDDGSPHYIEVKHVSLAYGTHGFFPDSVTERGTKHLQELLQLHNSGVGVTMFYLTQRSDIELFSAARDIDPVYADHLDQLLDAGVQVLVYRSSISPGEISVDSPIPLQP